jgi:hypothetical protein
MLDRPAPRRVLRIATLTLVAVVGLVAGQHLLARPDCGGFDPVAMGRIEADMWRNYYSHRWGRLGLGLMRATCGQYGFSWWDGIRVAAHAGRAAALFRVNTDDPRCLPELERYYRIVAPALRGRFDPAEAARLELAWWQERRRDMPPHAYADTIARLTALVHGIPRSEALPACLLRAEAMEYRDARSDGRMTEADWAEVTRILTAAHTDLRARLDAHKGATE